MNPFKRKNSEQREPLWDFDGISKERREYLRTPFDLDILVKCIRSEMNNIRYMKDRGQHQAKGAWRPLFCFDVSQETFDRFYNSPFGYRGQYLLDTKQGENFNSMLVSSLIDPLMQSIIVIDPMLERIRDSLISAHAKIWIDENQHDPLTPALIIQIRVPVWEAAARVIHERLKRSDATLTPKEVDRIYGVRAPLGKTLKVMGAWIPSLDPLPSKVRRSQDIKEYGIS